MRSKIIFALRSLVICECDRLQFRNLQISFQPTRASSSGIINLIPSKADQRISHLSSDDLMELIFNPLQALKNGSQPVSSQTISHRENSLILSKSLSIPGSNPQR